MPRYFFDIEDGPPDPDAEGTELPDEAAARVEAVRLAGAMMRDAAPTFVEEERWRVVVVSQDRRALFGVEVRPIAGSALTPWTTR